MKILFNKKFLNHNKESSGEGAYRIEEIAGENEDIDSNGEKYISLVHSENYIQKIEKGCNNNLVLAEVNVSPQSYEAAISAVGLTIMASEQNDFAIVRPPGHHAKREREDGFCLFNNIAIATQKLVDEGKKVFILDIDGHHGDGTQSIFYDSNRVLFCSIHQQHTYPGTGASNETGVNEGETYTMNFPLAAGSGDKELLAVIDSAIERAIDFNPDVVGISAGFDAYEKDRILQLNYSLNAYYECGYRISKAFKNVFAVLEGGYHYDIKKCVDKLIAGVNKARE